LKSSRRLPESDAMTAAVWLISIACSGKVKLTGGSPARTTVTLWLDKPATALVPSPMSGMEPRLRGVVTRAP
jgi:hypothetical protein